MLSKKSKNNNGITLVALMYQEHLKPKQIGREK